MKTHSLFLAFALALTSVQGGTVPGRAHSKPKIPKNAKHLKQLLRDIVRTGRAPASSSGIARGDFNADGFADLAIGIPLEDTPGDTSASGAVVVIYGSADGLVAATAATVGVPAPQFWSQNSDGIRGSSEAGDRFGTSLAAGEFNGDDFSDLAIGVPGESITINGVENEDMGRVVIIYGSPAGLAATGNDVVRAAQSFDLLNGRATNLLSEKLGQSLAWGDFNGDSIGDLAIGSPDFTPLTFTLFTQRDAGGVWILYGSLQNGLTTTGNQLLTQDSLRAAGGGDNEGDHFGASLAAGDFDGDGVSDLAVGVPDEDFSPGLFQNYANAGRVLVVRGRDGVGLNEQSAVAFSQATDGIVSFPLPNEQFGFALTTGDFDGDGRSELVIGLPGQAGSEVIINGSDASFNREAGAVHVLRGSAGGVTTANAQFFDQTALFGSGNETGDGFGRALAAGDFNGDGRADLAIGVPREDLAGGNNAGEVNVIYGSAAGLSTAAVRAPQRLGDTSAQANAEFGRTLSAWNFGRNTTVLVLGRPVIRRFADLAVGVPLKDISGITDAGAMHIFYGTSTGLTFTGEQEWTQDSPGIPGASEASDLFGAAGY